MSTNLVFSQKILFWSQQAKIQPFPWQNNKTMYKVWLSEIMLQQTRVNAVIPYYNKFIKRFPTITELATAKLNEILFMWSGLGYYNRAKNLHKTAKIIVNMHNSEFPENFNLLVSFPGIGKSTAGAILSLALNQSYPILDSNIRRILIRYYALNHDLIKDNKKNNTTLWTLIKMLIPINKKIANFNQAMMDLGRLICTSRNPKCNVCPLHNECQTFNTKNINQFLYIKNIQKNIKKTVWFLILLQKNYKKVWLEQRLSQKIWNKLFCFPEFSNFQQIKEWLLKHQIHYESIEKMNILKQKISNINLEIQPILLQINIQSNYNFNNGIWYNFINPPIIGLPNAISIILQKLQYYIHIT